MNIPRTPPKFAPKTEAFHLHPNPKWVKGAKSEPMNILVPGFKCECKKEKQCKSV